MKDLKVVEEVIEEHKKGAYSAMNDTNILAKAIFAALEKDGWAKFETPYDECAFCCHTNKETFMKDLIAKIIYQKMIDDGVSFKIQEDVTGEQYCEMLATAIIKALPELIKNI